MGEVKALELEPLNKAELKGTYEVVDEQTTKKLTVTVLNHNGGTSNATTKQSTETVEEKCDTKIIVRPTSKEYGEAVPNHYLSATGSRLRRAASASLPYGHRPKMFADNLRPLQTSDTEVSSIGSSSEDLLENGASATSTERIDTVDARPKNLKFIKDKVNKALRVRLSPAEEWALKKTLKPKSNLTRGATKIIKAGWKIRHELEKIKRSPNKSVNTFYLDTVASGDCEDVQALFNCTKTDRSLSFNKDCVNERDRDALRIAIDNEDAQMVKLLLRHKVKLRYNLFHAIDINFLEGIEAILRHDSCTDLSINTYNYYFKVGMTPLLLAAQNNNYEILKLLYSHDHRIKESVNWWEGIQHALESANVRTLELAAKASPAYITLLCEENRLDVMDFCLQLIKEIRLYSELDVEFFNFYEDLQNQVEQFMCSLLDQVQSSEELAHLFEYDFEAYWDTKSERFGNGAASLKACKSRLQLLDRASDYNLFSFVTHRNSQLALSYVRYRYTTFFKSYNAFQKFFFDAIFGLLFPIWCIFYLVAPWSKLGGIITLPNVTFVCHLTSDVVFIVLLVVNVAMKSPQTEYLGASPTRIEWLIFFWVLGKLVQEIKQGQSRGIKLYFRDLWNYIDVIQLTLFVVVIVLRIVDLLNHGYDLEAMGRNQWEPFEPRVISTGFLGWAYVFVFLQALSLMRTNRVIGPLQVSVAKMLLDIVQFFSIFSVIIFSFSLALTELYWYYGTPEGKEMFCETRNDTNCDIAFSGIPTSLGDLFWSLFGYFELSEVPLNDKLAFVYWASMVLLGTYHVIAIIILINMLIAMMAKTFDDTSRNRDVEWKFHRTVVWIRFIQRELTRPPPMNLFPNPYTIFKKLRHFFRWLSFSVCHCYTADELKRRSKMLRKRRKNTEMIAHAQLRELEYAAINIRKNLRNLLSKKVMFSLVERYKFGKLLNECSHHHHHHGTATSHA